MPEQPAAAALVAPVPQVPVERKPQPEAMIPQQARLRPVAPVVTAPPTRRLQPDDLICGDCGEGNPPTPRTVRKVSETRRVRGSVCLSYLSLLRGAMPCSQVYRASPVITRRLPGSSRIGTFVCVLR